MSEMLAGHYQPVDLDPARLLAAPRFGSSRRRPGSGRGRSAQQEQSRAHIERGSEWLVGDLNRNTTDRECVAEDIQRVRCRPGRIRV